MTLKDLNVEVKGLKIKVNEIYEWMELTQTRTLDKLTKKIEEQRLLLEKLQREYDK